MTTVRNTDDQPLRKKKKKRQDSNRLMLWIGAVVGGVGLLGAVLIAIFMLGRDNASRENRANGPREEKKSERPNPAGDTPLPRETPEELMREAVGTIRAIVVIYDSITDKADEATGEKAINAIKAESVKLRNLTKRFIQLGKPSAEQKKRVNEFAPEISGVIGQLRRASAAVIPNVQAAVRTGAMPLDVGERFKAANLEFANAIQEFSGLGSSLGY
jgi:flagellar basal body-associated protein FliL